MNHNFCFIHKCRCIMMIIRKNLESELYIYLIYNLLIHIIICVLENLYYDHIGRVSLKHDKTH